MRKWWLALMVGLVCCGQGAFLRPGRAEEPPALTTSGAAGSVLVAPPVMQWEAGPDSYPEPPGYGSRVVDWMRRHNLACWTHHNNYGCGSLKSECTFVFGSCRAFFGEPCLPKPPPTYGLPGFPGTSSQSRCGCP